MGILSGLFRTRDGPKNATSGSAYSFFMGSSVAGKNVNERSAMQMTAVYACVLGTVLDVLVGLFDVFAGIFTANWDQAWNGVKEVFSGYWEGIKGAFSVVLDGLKNLADV